MTDIDENALRVEQAPVALDATELLVLPRLVKVLKEEVSSAVVVRLAHKRIKECLAPNNRHVSVPPQVMTRHDPTTTIINTRLNAPAD